MSKDFINGRNEWGKLTGIQAADIDWESLGSGDTWNESFKSQMDAFLKKYYNLNQGCFMAGTMVATPKGDIPIEELTEGDIVYAYDFSTEEIVGREILKFHALKESDVIKVTFSDGQELRATKRHAFYEWDEKRWTKLGDFRVGDVIKTVDGEPVKIVSIEEIPGTQQVYNLTVREFENFFVIPQEIVAGGVPHAQHGIWSRGHRQQALMLLTHNVSSASMGELG